MGLEENKIKKTPGFPVVPTILQFFSLGHCRTELKHAKKSKPAPKVRQRANPMPRPNGMVVGRHASQEAGRPDGCEPGSGAGGSEIFTPIGIC